TAATEASAATVSAIRMKTRTAAPKIATMAVMKAIAVTVSVTTTKPSIAAPKTATMAEAQKKPALPYTTLQPQWKLPAPHWGWAMQRQRISLDNWRCATPKTQTTPKHQRMEA